MEKFNLPTYVCEFKKIETTKLFNKYVNTNVKSSTPNFHQNLIKDIGNVITKRKLSGTNYFNPKEIIDNYYINRRLYIVRALIGKYGDEIKGEFVKEQTKGIKVSFEDLEKREILDRYFIEMLYNQVPNLLHSNLPVVFCDTYSDGFVPYQPSYYIL